MAHRDSWARAFQSHRLGHRLRHQRLSSSGRDLQAGAVRRRRCIEDRSQLDDLRGRQTHWQISGSASRTRARLATSATSNRPTPAPLLSPTAASSSRGSDRKVSMRTMSTGAFCGRSNWAGSTWAHTTFRRTNGARPARRSSGTGWLSSVRHADRFVHSGARCDDRQDGLEDRARRNAIVGHADRRDHTCRARNW